MTVACPATGAGVSGRDFSGVMAGAILPDRGLSRRGQEDAACLSLLFSVSMQIIDVAAPATRDRDGPPVPA